MEEVGFGVLSFGSCSFRFGVILFGSDKNGVYSDEALSDCTRIFFLLWQLPLSSTHIEPITS